MIFSIDTKILDHLKPRLDVEANSIREYAIKPITALPVSCERKEHVNRLVLNSAFDINKIKSIVVSDVRSVPELPSTLSVTVLMMGDVIEMPLISMYLFPGTIKTKPHPSFEKELKEWLIVNKGIEKRLTIHRNDWPTERRKRIDVDR